jgi:CRISPR/Cas system-associated endonuclease Cas1
MVHGIRAGALPPKDILDVVEKIKPSAVVDALIADAVRQKLIEPSAEEGKDGMLAGLLAAREYALGSIEAGLTGN